jgi:8-oxo-dGTP pyrophosphatase MutT (NUDIX family)
MNEMYCNNCGKTGHMYSQCKVPITSYGVIAFRYNPLKHNQIEYLMIRRKNSLGFLDFMRGKYNIQNKQFILNMIKQMTLTEKEDLKTKTFDELWKILWSIPSSSHSSPQSSLKTKNEEEYIHSHYKNEELSSKDKFNMLKIGIYSKNKKWLFNIQSLMNECELFEQWNEPEWGFPKGRRNYQEKDFDTAIREFSEETGHNSHFLKNIQNIFPLEEIFMGSNYKSYKHKYYLMYIDYCNCKDENFKSSEVSKIEWKSYENCIKSIRSYNFEKKKIITNVHQLLNKSTNQPTNQPLIGGNNIFSMAYEYKREK